MSKVTSEYSKSKDFGQGALHAKESDQFRMIKVKPDEVSSLSNLQIRVSAVVEEQVKKRALAFLMMLGVFHETL